MTYLYVIPFTIPWSILMMGLLIISAGFISFGKKGSWILKRRLLSFLGFYLLFDLIVFEYYFFYHDSFSLKLTLPFAYCSIMQMIASYAAIKRSRVAFEFSLLLGIVAPLQSFMSPIIVRTGEDYLLIDYFLSHGAIILVPIFMWRVLRFRPRKFAFIYTTLIMQIVVIGIYFIDVSIGANYMYLVKPPEGNLVISGPWPIYLIHMHLGVYLTAILINFIFILSDLLERKTTGKIQ